MWLCVRYRFLVVDLSPAIFVIYFFASKFSLFFFFFFFFFTFSLSFPLFMRFIRVRAFGLCPLLASVFSLAGIELLTLE